MSKKSEEMKNKLEEIIVKGRTAGIGSNPSHFNTRVTAMGFLYLGELLKESAKATQKKSGSQENCLDI